MREKQKQIERQFSLLVLIVLGIAFRINAFVTSAFVTRLAGFTSCIHAIY